MFLISKTLVFFHILRCVQVQLFYWNTHSSFQDLCTRNSELCFVFLQNIFEWMEFLKELYTLLSWLFGFWILKKLLMRAQDELNFLECGARGDTINAIRKTMLSDQLFGITKMYYFIKAIWDSIWICNCGWIPNKSVLHFM